LIVFGKGQRKTPKARHWTKHRYNLFRRVGIIPWGDLRKSTGEFFTGSGNHKAGPLFWGRESSRECRPGEPKHRRQGQWTSQRRSLKGDRAPTTKGGKGVKTLNFISGSTHEGGEKDGHVGWVRPPLLCQEVNHNIWGRWGHFAVKTKGLITKTKPDTPWWATMKRHRNWGPQHEVDRKIGSRNSSKETRRKRVACKGPCANARQGTYHEAKGANR